MTRTIAAATVLSLTISALPSYAGEAHVASVSSAAGQPDMARAGHVIWGD